MVHGNWANRYKERFALCYGTVVLSVCHVCIVGVLCPNGWMDQDATWYAGRPRPRRHCVRLEPSSPTERGTAAFPTFRLMSIWPNGRPSQLLLSSCCSVHEIYAKLQRIAQDDRFWRRVYSCLEYTLFYLVLTVRSRLFGSTVFDI